MPFGNIFKKGKHHDKAEEHDEKSSEHSIDDLPTIDTVADTSDAWLNGQEAHLTSEQAKAFDHFKAALQKEGLYTPASNLQPASHDDSTLLRFLRARRFDVQGGLKQFEDTEKWRKENHIDELYAEIDIDSYEESRRMYPQWTGRRDKRGIPVYVFVIKHLNNKNMAAYSEKTDKEPVLAKNHPSTVPNRLLRLFALYENMTQFVAPLCSSLPRPHPESPIVATTNIVDISGVGLKQFWNLKSHMQDASVLATAHYPETLDRIYIIGAPSFFPTVWGWIKRWFDPVTTSKIFILSASEVKSTLERFMPPTSIPKQYGGELDWQWGDMPKLDEPARQIAGALERVDPRTAEGDVAAPSSTPSFLIGPVKWVGDRLEILGSLAGAIRHRIITISDQTQSASVAASSTASAAKPPAAIPPATALPRTTPTITATTTSLQENGFTKTETIVEAESETESGVHVDAHSDIEVPSLAIFADEAYEIDYHHGLLGAPLLASGQSPASKTAFYFGKAVPGAKASLIYTLSDKLMLGAINPKDGAVVWRQDIASSEHAEARANPAVQALVKQVYGGDSIVTGVEDTVSSWTALNGRLIWTTSVEGNIVDIATAGDVAVLSQKGSNSVAQYLDATNGMVKWEYKSPRYVSSLLGVSLVHWLIKNHSGETPVKLVSTSTGVVYISIQSSKSKIHVSTLDTNSGEAKSDYSISSGSDISSPASIAFIGDDAASPVIVWADKNYKTLKINVIGSQVVQDFPIGDVSGESIEGIHVHAPSEPSNPTYILVSYETATSSWADSFQIDTTEHSAIKATSLPRLQDKSLFAASFSGGDTFFTRITKSDVTLFSASKDVPLAHWPLSDLVDKSAVHAISEVVTRNFGWSVRFAQIHSSGDWSIVLNGEQKWARPESLANVVAAEWASMPIEEVLAHELEVEGSKSVLEAYIHRVKRHIRDLQHLGDFLRELPLKLGAGFLPTDGTALERFDVGKKIIVATRQGRVAAIDTSQHGKIAWNTEVADLADGEAWDVKAIKSSRGFATIYSAKGGFFKIDITSGVVVDSQKPGQETASLAFLDDSTPIRVNKAGVPDFSDLSATTEQQFIVTRSDDGRILGWSTADSDTPAWAFAPPTSEKVVDVVSRAANEPVASIGTVLGDRSVLYKYLNPNLILVTAAGQSSVSFYLLNGVSGQILHSAKHINVDVTKPIASAISENWFAYSLFSDVSEHSKSKGYQLVINELYKSPVKNDRGELGSAANYTNIDVREPHVIRQSYIIAEPISVMAATQTRQGITMRNLVVYLPESGSIAAIPRVLLNARRPVGREPTPAEVEEGLIPYAPYLEIDGRWYLSHTRDVRDIKHIMTSPTMLESTGLVFAYGGLDLFGTRVHPSMAFDVLGKGFNKVQLVLTVVGLAVGVAMLQPIATKKQINQMWKS
ncbi:hypothetical protein KEM56_006804 [Ascosphaera pollenicola]|nr:hypothetical protein KEM56_006804 [Ascosphaera pollenicola]